MYLFIIIGILLILFTIYIVWHNLIVPSYSYKIKLDILIIKENILEYCNKHTINNKKEILKMINSVYFNIDDISIIEFLFFVKMINRKNINKHSNNEILSNQDNYIKNQIEKVFIIVIKKMIFSSVIASILFFIYSFIELAKSNLKDVYKDILSKVDIINLYKLFEKLDYDKNFNSSDELLNMK